jgi:hypothetical protein
MANNNDRHLLDLMTKQAKIMEYALEECVKQFDYSNNKEWREDFKQMMVTHAKDRLKRESEQH